MHSEPLGLVTTIPTYLTLHILRLSQLRTLWWCWSDISCSPRTNLGIQTCIFGKVKSLITHHQTIHTFVYVKTNMNSSSAHLSLFLWSGSLILRVNLRYFPTALTLMYLGVLTRTESHLGNRCGNMTSDPQCSEHTSARAHTHTLLLRINKTLSWATPDCVNAGLCIMEQITKPCCLMNH